MSYHVMLSDIDSIMFPRFGVTMLSNDISYVVHGYVKAIPKDVVMMYVATPEDGKIIYIIYVDTLELLLSAWWLE